ncbi:hypothetical protein TMRH483_02173 [Qipengyuania sp. 483]
MAAPFLSRPFHRRLEIGGLVGNPAQEPGHVFRGGKTIPIVTKPRQFGIGEIGVDRLVADRMDRHRCPALLRFWDRMVPLDAAAQRATA